MGKLLKQEEHKPKPKTNLPPNRTDKIHNTPRTTPPKRKKTHTSIQRNNEERIPKPQRNREKTPKILVLHRKTPKQFRRY